jgi:hypothetical protein
MEAAGYIIRLKASFTTKSLWYFEIWYYMSEEAAAEAEKQGPVVYDLSQFGANLRIMHLILHLLLFCYLVISVSYLPFITCGFRFGSAHAHFSKINPKGLSCIANQNQTIIISSLHFFPSINLRAKRMISQFQMSGKMCNKKFY